jgi:hypothetical protein
MLKIFLKRLSFLFLGGIFLFVCLATVTNISNDLTQDDRLAFRIIGIKNPSIQKQFKTYDDEIKEIRDAQTLIFSKIAISENGIPEFKNREPLDLIKVGAGLCFDRSRMLDKVYQYLGYETRHVYLLFFDNKNPLIAMLTYRQPSHAVTEVKTSRGWVMVDSLEPFVAIGKNAEPLLADRLWEQGLNGLPKYFEVRYFAVRGMYSRKGFFYSPWLPFPEFNWGDFLTWLTKG